MPFASVRGVNLNYQVFGDSGPWVTLTAGARRPLEAVKSFAARIAGAGYRVLIHDRRNCGSSDVGFDDEGSESRVWADDLAALLYELHATPVLVGGASSGARVSLLLALHHPDTVRALFLWRISGGPIAAQRLAEDYYGHYIKVAERGGMTAICETEHFRDGIAARPSNRDRLLGMDPRDFMRVMAYWRRAMLDGADDPVIGLNERELRTIRLPACVVPGNDRMHPQQVGRRLAALLPHAELHQLFAEDLDVDTATLDSWNQREPELVAIAIDFFKRVTN